MEIATYVNSLKLLNISAANTEKMGFIIKFFRC